jgi:hypothetical protein
VVVRRWEVSHVCDLVILGLGFGLVMRWGCWQCMWSFDARLGLGFRLAGRSGFRARKARTVLVRVFLEYFKTQGVRVQC